MISALIKATILSLINFYSLSFQNIDGNTINMSNFQGKKILIVNIATGSDKVDQLAGIQQLQQSYGDSLVVIVFPSNSFGHENRSAAAIKNLCKEKYKSTFIIAAQSSVIGVDVNAVFNWLCRKEQNGEVNATISNDFQKFLINTDGTILGIFSSKISPSDPNLISTITTIYNF